MATGSCIRALAAAAALFAAGPAFARPVDANALTAEMARRIGEAAPALKVTVAGPLTLSLKGGAIGEGQFNLDRLAAFCAENEAADCEALKAAMVKGAVETATSDRKVTPERLRVAVRARAYLDAVQQGAAARGGLLRRPLAEGIDAVLLADFPSSAAMLGPADLAPLGLTEADAFALGRRNVLARLPKLPTAAELDGAVVVIAGEDYDASLLLADGWAQLARAAGGGLFAVVPDDNRLIVGTMAELPSLRALAANGFRAAQRGISPDVLRWSDKGWVKAK